VLARAGRLSKCALGCMAGGRRDVAGSESADRSAIHQKLARFSARPASPIAPRGLVPAIRTPDHARRDLHGLLQCRTARRNAVSKVPSARCGSSAPRSFCLTLQTRVPAPLRRAGFLPRDRSPFGTLRRLLQTWPFVHKPAPGTSAPPRSLDRARAPSGIARSPGHVGG